MMNAVERTGSFNIHHCPHPSTKNTTALKLRAVSDTKVLGPQERFPAALRADASSELVDTNVRVMKLDKA
jgi:hypothetical protein